MAPDDEDGYLYASVTSFSRYVFVAEDAIPLKSPGEHAYERDITELVTTTGEVLVARSGATVGVSYPTDALPPEFEGRVIPSGFVIRIEPDPDVFVSTYVSAVLNHPVWRAWTYGLSAGKSQRNLSHEQLESLQVPMLELDHQRELGDAYLDVLAQIATILDEPRSITAMCDGIIASHLGIASLPTLELRGMTVRSVSNAAVAGSPSLRCDARYHRPEIREALEPLASLESHALSDLDGRWIRGRQPVYEGADEESEPRVIATRSLQAGCVVDELMKHPNDEWFSGVDSGRLLAAGDLLVAMDGQGSIGKAAPFEIDRDAVTDTHVAALRTGNPDLAAAVACFFNSSLGQAQIEASITGSTGQTQISVEAIESMRIPVEIIDRASEVSKAYRLMTSTFESPPVRMRRALLEFQLGTLAKSLIVAGALDASAPPAARALLEDPTCVAELSEKLDGFRRAGL